MRARRRDPRPSVTVLRIGHRPGRDPRLTTHVALAARALGAERLILHPPDPGLSDRVAAVSARWGGAFRVEGVEDWRRVVRSWEGRVAHLTMYGRPLKEALPRLRHARAVLLVVGGAKVPPDLYGLSDENVAVGNQPHSEVAAVAVVLDRLLDGTRPRRWKGARQRVRPSSRSKRVIDLRGPDRR